MKINKTSIQKNNEHDQFYSLFLNKAIILCMSRQNWTEHRNEHEHEQNRAENEHRTELQSLVDSLSLNFLVYLAEINTPHAKIVLRSFSLLISSHMFSSFIKNDFIYMFRNIGILQVRHLMKMLLIRMAKHPFHRLLYPQSITITSIPFWCHHKTSLALEIKCLTTNNNFHPKFSIFIYYSCPFPMFRNIFLLP